jgi:nitrogen fixation protein
MKKLFSVVIMLFFVAILSACSLIGNNVDNEVPVITLTGGAATLIIGGTLEEPVCSVSDNLDTDLTCIKTGEVNVNILGEYTLAYNTVDTFGNAAIEKTFIVTVVGEDYVDTVVPVITLTGGKSTLTVGDSFEEPTCSVSDNLDTNLTCIKTGEVNVNIVGEYTLTYNASDTAGNAADEKTFVVTVVGEDYIDTEVPVITLTGGTNLVSVGEPFEVPTCSVTDNFDIDLTCIKTGEVDISVPGEYTLSFNVSDTAGNAAVERTFIIEVELNISTYRDYYNQLTNLGSFDITLNEVVIKEFINLMNDNEFIKSLYTLDGKYGSAEESYLTQQEIDEFYNIFGYFSDQIVRRDHFREQDFFYINGDFTYLDSAETILIGYTGNDLNVTIPAGVKTIGFGAMNNCKLISVIIPDSVEVISSSAFDENYITSITIPDSVRSIGMGAFDRSYLDTIIIEGVETRFNSMWEEIGFPKELASFIVTTEDGIEFNKFSGKITDYEGNLADLVIPSEIQGAQVTSLENHAFYNAGLDSVTIPESVTQIGYRAFYDNNLTEIVILGDDARFNDKWIEIGLPIELASFIFTTEDGIQFNKSNGEVTGFKGTQTSLEIPSEIDGVAVVSIGEEAFERNRTLTSVTIPDSVITIEKRAFASTKGNLVTVELGTGVQYIGYEAFKGHGITSVVIPESVVSIGYEAFYATNEISEPIVSIVINGEETRFDDIWADIGFPMELATFIINTEDGLQFNKITGEISSYNGTATSLVIPSEIDGVAVISIGKSAFDGNRIITSVTIPDSVITIKERAFASTKGNLVTLVLGNGVQVIEYEAFKGHGITGIVIPESVISIGAEAFHATNELDDPIVSVVINGVETRFDENWVKIGFPIDITTFVVTTEDGILFNKSTGEIIDYTGINPSLIIPAEIEGVAVTSIGENGINSDNLESLTIPESVTKIENYAFNLSNLSEIVILGDETRFDNAWEELGLPIELASFMFITVDGLQFNKNSGEITGYVGNLTSLVIPSIIDGVEVKSIGEYSFEGNREITSVTIPDSVLIIKDRAFASTKGTLDTLVLGSGVIVIEYGAFKGHGITEIVIPENVAIIGYQAFYPTNDLDDPIESILINGDDTRFDDEWFDIGLPIELAPFIVTTADGIVFNMNLGEIIEYEGILTTLVIPSTINSIPVTTIGYDVFYNKGLVNITIPESVIDIIFSAFSYNNFTEITILGVETRFDNSWTQIGFPIELASFVTITDEGLILNVNTGEIIGYNGTLTTLVIPSVINGIDVISIGEQAFEGNRVITSVTIPDSVKTIKNRAFASTKGTLVTLDLGNGVKDIGYEAFKGHGITSIVIPESVTSLGDNAFYPTNDLEDPIVSIVINGDASRFNERWLEIGLPIDLATFIVTTEDGLLFNKSTGEIFAYTGTLSVLVIPSVIDEIPVTQIGERIFEGNRTITSVTIPDSVITIKERAFASTKGTLVTLVLGNGVQIIEYEAFKGHGIAEIVIPESVISIGDYAFYPTNDLDDPIVSVVINGVATRFDNDWEDIGFPAE